MLIKAVVQKGDGVASSIKRDSRGGVVRKDLLFGTSIAYDTASILRGIRGDTEKPTLTQLAIAKTGQELRFQ